MKFLALLVSAVAVTASVVPLDARANTKISYLPSKSINCGGKDARASTYKVSTIKSAAEAAFSHVLAKTTVGANNYPHKYGYRDPSVKFPDSVCKHGDTLYEFPIETHGKYTGGDVANLPDRVVIKQKSTKEAYYCGLITHINAPPQAGVAAPFTSCSG